MAGSAAGRSVAVITYLASVGFLLILKNYPRRRGLPTLPWRCEDRKRLSVKDSIGIMLRNMHIAALQGNLAGRTWGWPPCKDVLLVSLKTLNDKGRISWAMSNTAQVVPQQGLFDVPEHPGRNTRIPMPWCRMGVPARGREAFGNLRVLKWDSYMCGASTWDLVNFEACAA